MIDPDAAMAAAARAYLTIPRPPAPSPERPSFDAAADKLLDAVLGALSVEAGKARAPVPHDSAAAVFTLAWRLLPPCEGCKTRKATHRHRARRWLRADLVRELCVGCAPPEARRVVSRAHEAALYQLAELFGLPG